MKKIKQNTYFVKQYICNSMSHLKHITNKNTDNFNASDMIIMPESALVMLHEYKESQYHKPYTFKITNPKNNKSIYTSVREFTSPNDRAIYVPNWMMNSIGILDGHKIMLLSIELPDGDYIKFEPLDSNFFKISNPRVILENFLQNFKTLTLNQILHLNYCGKNYTIKIIDLKPDHAILISNIDIKFEIVNNFESTNNNTNDPAIKSMKSEIFMKFIDDANKNVNYWSFF